MSWQIMTIFFMWCSIINVGLLILFSLLWIITGDFIYKMHGICFPMPRETFNAVVYGFVGFYKILVIVFNIIPWIVLLLIQ